ncbi:hypothetical protein E2C01_083796 [Portunus trituberculatus]|uniref:Uncharacterized protein n=1 Tax=Portunus trituberculatus TaxID=210409 RepID=A0A5B7J357_PORTR|nr:hypothetical protein [Portunus trituberculatus]
MKSHKKKKKENVKYCTKEINKTFFFFLLPLTRHVFYQMMSLPRLRDSRDFSPYSSSAEWADED